jgi:uncharacterized protein YjbJ (UPF0337 family)
MTAADKARNKVDKWAGRAKESFGEATGNRRMRTEGRVDQMKAEVRTAGESIKDVFRGNRRNRQTRRPR